MGDIKNVEKAMGFEKYLQKSSYIIEKMEGLPDPETDVGFDALLYRIHSSIEAAMDITAMLVKEYGYDVGDDYHNLELLNEKGVIDATITDRMKKLNGMRNIIVHRYNKIEKEIITSNLEEIKKVLFNFLEAVEDAYKEIHR